MCAREESPQELCEHLSFTERLVLSALSLRALVLFDDVLKIEPTLIVGPLSSPKAQVANVDPCRRLETSR
jgi:hypothetical protein